MTAAVVLAGECEHGAYRWTCACLNNQRLYVLCKDVTAKMLHSWGGVVIFSVNTRYVTNVLENSVTCCSNFRSVKVLKGDQVWTIHWPRTQWHYTGCRKDQPAGRRHSDQALRRRFPEPVSERDVCKKRGRDCIHAGKLGDWWSGEGRTSEPLPFLQVQSLICLPDVDCINVFYYISK